MISRWAQIINKAHTVAIKVEVEAREEIG